MKSIRVRLTVMFSVICVGCLLIAMISASLITKNSLTESNEMLHGQQVEYYAAVIDSWLQANTRDVDAACSYFETLSSIDDASIRAYMEQLTANNENASNINVGLTISSSLTEPAGIRTLTGIVPEDHGIRVPYQQGGKNFLASLM